MTLLEFGDNVEEVREIVVGMLTREFRNKMLADVEDIAHAVIKRCVSKVDEFSSKSALQAYACEVAKLWTIEELNKKIERRNKLKGLPKVRPQRDSMRHIDYRIDLERAILRRVNTQPLRNACWLVIYEGWDRDEVCPTLPTERSAEGWRKQLLKALKAVRRELERMGYKSLLNHDVGPYVAPRRLTTVAGDPNEMCHGVN